MWANDKPDRSFELNLARGKKQSSCSPGWMYSIGEAFVGLSAADELPDGYATSVGFGERFRNGEFLPLFSEYPLLIYLLILGILVTVCGIAYVIYRWRVGTPLYRYLDNEISKELSMWFCMCYILALITCVFLLFSIAIMLTANKNIRKTKEDRAWRLKLADESINEIISKLENVNFARPLENVNQISAKFHRAIERKAQPYLGESLRSVDNLDLVNYKSDVNELLETFAHCNAYMLHFLDSWRYYDTNATRFAKLVNTMESRKALQAVRRVREDFANVVYKVMQQNRAFYNYYRELETLSDEMLTEHVKNNDRSLEFANTIDKNLQNIETKLEALGTSLQQRANKIYELKENLLEVSSGAGYIEFSDTLITFGYVVSILMMLIVFLALIFMPLWYLGSLYCRKCKWIAGILPLTTAAFIFIFYLVFVLTIMYYFLHGMVAKDGICDGKRALDAGRADIIDDCIINSAIFENYSHTKAKSIYDTSTSEIEAALKAIETLPRRVKRAPTTKPSAAEKFERFRINKTVIQDIYVEMLKVAVYAPKNIEPFALIWHANRLSKVKALQELNCTHAIGNTMAVSLHGQVASEMDKLYRTTWRVEALLQDLPTQLKANRDDTGDFDGITELTKNLRAIFNAGKEPLRRIISHSAGPKLPTCKSVAQLYKSLKTPACECLVPSMNLYWFGAFVAICLLLLLLALILCLEEMIRRSALSNRESRSRLKPSKSHHSHRGRGSSRTRSSSRPERLSRRDMLPRHLQRQQQQQPSHGQRDMKDNFTFESYPDMPAKLQQARSLERKPDKRKEPRNVWKNEAFRYPGPGGSDISTMLQCFRGPRSISKTLEQRGRSQPSERSANIHHKEPTLIAQRSTNETLVDGPTTSGAIPKIKLPPGKVGIVVCPCGCGKPSKIYGTKQDIERIRKAGKVCIAKRGQQFKDKRLRPLASVVELKGTEEGNEDVA
ncbi:uncharacterized protein LOC105232349 isoform X2 [Bactrocera dorsalis]|uniref:Uncharacterized protein LOC105232349 isoform X2 n=1 Tax=Bactrocera dorsalis TaxID=27457 RepID=A0A6I9VK32_BACDO|nr:uncharacterized protein LOC105232349 isoform X2 [Bactrocera dorsalis]